MGDIDVGSLSKIFFFIFIAYFLLSSGKHPLMINEWDVKFQLKKNKDETFDKVALLIRDFMR